MSSLKTRLYLQSFEGYTKEELKLKKSDESICGFVEEETSKKTAGIEFSHLAAAVLLYFERKKTQIGFVVCCLAHFVH